MERAIESVDGETAVMKEWAEEHWESLALVVSVAGALAVAATVIVVFNVLTTRVG